MLEIEVEICAVKTSGLQIPIRNLNLFEAFMAVNLRFLGGRVGYRNKTENFARSQRLLAGLCRPPSPSLQLLFPRPFHRSFTTPKARRCWRNESQKFYRCFVRGVFVNQVPSAKTWLFKKKRDYSLFPWFYLQFSTPMGYDTPIQEEKNNRLLFVNGVEQTLASSSTNTVAKLPI